jgi:hypothetical protein
MINVQKRLVSISEEKRLRVWCRWNSNTEIDVKEAWYRDVYVTQLIQHSDIYRMNRKKNLSTILIQSHKNFEFDQCLSNSDRKLHLIHTANHKL